MQRSLLIKLSAFTCFSLVFSNAAFANFPNYFAGLFGDLMCCTHWYVAGNLGVSHLHDRHTPGLIARVKQNGPGWNVNAGVQFMEMLGAEVGYTQYHYSREVFGGNNFSKTEHYAIYLAATAQTPEIYNVSVFGKFGVAYSYANKIFNLGPTASAEAVSPYAGLGLAFKLSCNTDFVGEWGRVFGNRRTGTADLFSVGFKFAIA